MKNHLSKLRMKENSQAEDDFESVETSGAFSLFSLRLSMNRVFERIHQFENKRTRPDTRHKMRLICVFSPSKITRDQRTYGRTDGHDLI